MERTIIGLLITFEGPEGAGKSLQIARLAQQLARHNPLVTREPGDGGMLGDRIRDLLLHGGQMSGITELFLFLADRAQHVAEVIRPALNHGRIVLCDRYADSTDVYQGIARGVGLEATRVLNGLATEGLIPDMTILLDLPPEVGLARVTKGDRLDKEGLAFHQRVREGFLQIAAEEPERFRVIDAAQTPDEVAAAIEAAVGPLLAGRGYNTPDRP